jgi:hypothetical protein
VAVHGFFIQVKPVLTEGWSRVQIPDFVCFAMKYFWFMHPLYFSLGLLLASHHLSVTAAPAYQVITDESLNSPGFTPVGIVFRPESDQSQIYLRFRDKTIQSFELNALVGSWKVTEIKQQSFTLQKEDSHVNYSMVHQSTSGSIDKNKRKITRLQIRSLEQEFSAKLDKYINGRVLASVPYPFGVFSYGIEQLSEQAYRVDRTAIIDQAKKNNIINHVKFEFDEGLVMTEVVPGSVFDNIGLVHGDKIRTINGRPVESEQDMFDLYKELLVSETLNLELLRDDNSYQYNYQVLDSD